MAFPNATPTDTPPSYSATATVETRTLTTEETEELTRLYEMLKPEATEMARNYVLARTPAKYQLDMAALIEADWPAPPVMDPEMVESRRRDATAYQRPATPV
jgi:hypothetical protein